MRGFCHGVSSFLLSAHADRTRMAVRHAPVGVAERLRRRVPDNPGPPTPTAEAAPCAETLCRRHHKAALRRLCARHPSPPASPRSAATTPRAPAGAPPLGRHLHALLSEPGLCVSGLGRLGESPGPWPSQWGSLAAAAVCRLSRLFSRDAWHALAW